MEEGKLEKNRIETILEWRTLHMTSEQCEDYYKKVENFLLRYEDCPYFRNKLNYCKDCLRCKR